MSKDAPYILAESATTPIILTGSGPNKERQEGSHAHQVFYHEENNEIIVPDLGGDRIYRLKKDQGTWKVESHIPVQPGSGPRHVAIYGMYQPKIILYGHHAAFTRWLYLHCARAEKCHIETLLPFISQ